MIATVPTPSPQIHAAVASYGLEPHRFDLISPLGQGKGRRLAFRVETTDG